MTNGEKYKTAEKRYKEHSLWCDRSGKQCRSAEGSCVLCFSKWLDLEADEDREINVGDTIAYRSCDDNQPEWKSFTVRLIKDGYLYENEDCSGDNIAIECAHKVNVRK